MIEWIIPIIVVIGMILLIKTSHFKHKFKIISIVVLLLFFYFTFINVTANNNITLKTPSGFFNGIKAYFFWIGHVFDNMKVLTGNVIRMDWSGNSTR